jgi:DNA-directed RNA polymerase subunit K/omega
MVHRSHENNSFEFVRVASLRAAQLMRGCTARVPASAKAVVTAQLEVASGKVHAIRPPAGPGMADWPE